MKKNSNFDKLVNGKGFYVALAVCLVAIAASVLGIFYSAKQITEFNTKQTETESYTYYTSTALSDDEQAEKNQTGIADERTTQDKPAESTSSVERSTTVEAVNTTEATTAQTTAETKATYVLPLGRDITKDYSGGEMVYSATMDDWRVHNGIDFAAEQGSKVKAIGDGVVTAVISDELYGLIVVIDHSNGVIARYCGLEQGTTVIKDSKVKSGETVGCLGTIPCESEDGYHLHFEITKNGASVDPLEIMGKSGE